MSATGPPGEDIAETLPEFGDELLKQAGASGQDHPIPASWWLPWST